MSKIEEYKELLIEHTNEELTTKYLREDLGISSYFISELTKGGFLEKSSRGVYKVLCKDKDNEEKKVANRPNSDSISKMYFENFTNFTLHENYYDAYQALIKCVENSHNHKYDNHYRLYFILLTHILKSKGFKFIPYDYEDKLLAFYRDSNSKYFECYVSFEEAVLSQDFEKANYYLEEFAAKELTRYKENKISVIIFKKLFETINEIRENGRIIITKLFEIKELINQKQYEDVLEGIGEIKPFVYSVQFQNMIDYLEILSKKVIDFQKDCTLVLPGKKQYNFKDSDSLSHKFYIYMKDGDYLSAVEIVDKCFELYKNTYYLTARKLLKAIVELNNSNKRTYRDSEIREMRAFVSQDNNYSNIYYNRFLSDLQKLDFNSALGNLKKSLSYVEDTNNLSFSRNYYLFVMLKLLSEMNQNRTVLEEKNIVYSDSDSDIYKMNFAIKMKDFINAKKFASRINIGSSLSLEACKLLITAIIRQDKINRGIKLTEEDELKPLSCHLQNKTNNELSESVMNSVNEIEEPELDNSDESLNSQSENNCLQDSSIEIKESVSNSENSDSLVQTCEEESQPNNEELSGYEKHRLEVLESIKDIELNYNNLYDLVYNLEYEKAIFLIERENVSSRLYFNARRLISRYLHIVKGTFKTLESKPIDYTQDSFKLFYAALNNCDYAFALEIVDECIEKAREPEEFQLYKIIIGDIIDELDKQKKVQEAKKEIEEIKNNLQKLAQKREFDDSNVRVCYELLSKKLELSNQCGLSADKDLLIFGVAEVAMMALNNGLNDYYFADVTNTNVDDEFSSGCINVTSSSPEIVFSEALKYGDYLTAEKLLSTNNWNTFRKNMTSVNLRLLKNLFLYIHNRMDIVKQEDNNIAMQHTSQESLEKVEKDAYSLLDEKGKENYKKLELLESLRALINHQKYKAALGLLLESEVPLDQDESLIDIISDILLVKEGVKEVSHALFDEFIAAERAYDIDQAYESLKEYSSYLASKSIDRDIRYHYSRLRILEKDLKQPNFEEKEALYINAFKAFKRKQYKTTINYLNQYIAMDNDLNYKGYKLRAQAYRKLSLDKEAKADFKKALSISPDPDIYYPLGKYAFENEDYKRAAYYLELFHAVRPFKHREASKMLAVSYNSLGEKEKAVPYTKYLKHLSKLKGSWFENIKTEN